MIAGQTHLYSLLGSPVSHSLSPVIFNTTFEKLGMQRAYVPFEVGRTELKRGVEAARSFGIEGFNVTMPHKTAILEFIDRLDETAEKAGAVNTVSSTKNGFVGHNTDGEGAELAIEAYRIEPKDKRILVIGAGGAARAIVERLASIGCRIKLLNRTPQTARDIIDMMEGAGKGSFEILEKTVLERSLGETDGVVNATPLQTTALLAQFGIPLSALSQPSWVFDLAYDKELGEIPAKTRRISPLEMLVQQAALSYEKWFVEKAPVGLMRSALIDHVGRDWR